MGCWKGDAYQRLETENRSHISPRYCMRSYGKYALLLPESDAHACRWRPATPLGMSRGAGAVVLTDAILQAFHTGLPPTTSIEDITYPQAPSFGRIPGTLPHLLPYHSF